MHHASSAADQTQAPVTPALAIGFSAAVWLTPDGLTETLTFQRVVERLRRGAVPIVCHRLAAARRLDAPAFAAYDLLELFAFVRPAQFCAPTARSLAKAVNIAPPETLADEAITLPAIAHALLSELTASPGATAAAIARAMAAGHWPWAEPVLHALSRSPGTDEPQDTLDGLKAWRRIADWEELGPPDVPDSWPVEPVEARARLVKLLGNDAELRPQQMVYATYASAAFLPRQRSGEPRVVIAEAGTGIGKTLGYIAPASLWAQKNRGHVWISTFTRNLQRQLDRELDRAYPEPLEKRTAVVVRKGRENLFCLLNFEEAVLALSGRPEQGDAIALGLIARWVGATRDGDMIGGDFPAWLVDLLGRRLTTGLTDTFGECIYGACAHFRRCFIERAIRRAERAEIVVANHALVMVQAAHGGEEGTLPLRYVFDEAHHLFDAADNAFSLALSGDETAELRRWLRGPEGASRSRRRGLRDRAGELLSTDGEGREALDRLLAAARTLPGPGWRQRLAGGIPQGPTESLLAEVRAQVLARNADREKTHDLEAPLRPVAPELVATVPPVLEALARLGEPLKILIRSLSARLDDEADDLDTATRQRIEAVRRSLTRRVLEPIHGWQAMLTAVIDDTPSRYVDYLSITRADGEEIDVGLRRHWLDPTRPFADTVLNMAHGVLITSATLRDTTGDDDADWAAAEARTGVGYLRVPPTLSALSSPFDYARLTKVLIVGDVSRDDPAQVAAAYRELFLAARGGALGLFTAISRLRTVYDRTAAALAAAGIRLLAQHVDALDVGSLIDIFREEEDSCLLGTDAVRDGVDVPGRSLRLIVFDRVPWPRPSILHRYRREAFGGRGYDEMLVRSKLKQAYGRLIRQQDDRGVFVMLDRAMPSRLLSAFPAGVPVLRLGLAPAIALVRAHLGGLPGGEIVP